MLNIIEFLQEGEHYNFFLKAIFETNFQNILIGKGPFTLLVPGDKAFQLLADNDRRDLFGDSERLKRLVGEHVVIGSLYFEDLRQSDEIVNMNNHSLAVERHGEGLIVGGAKIVMADRQCKNGIVHEIDIVLLS